MPNHVTNILKIIGPDEMVEMIKKKITSKSGDKGVDLNKIKRMPKCMMVPRGTLTDNGIAILKYRQGDDSAIRKIMGYAWGKAFETPEDLVSYLIESGRADLEDAQLALNNIEKYGVQDWWEWSHANWGTKWNAYSTEYRSDGTIKFETANATPVNAMITLSNKYPEVEINVRFADEDTGYNVGEYTLKEGKVISKYTPKGGSDEAVKMAIDICGEWEYIKELCMKIEAEDIDDLNDGDKRRIEMLLEKELIDEDYPIVVLQYMEKIAVDQEKYELAKAAKDASDTRSVSSS